MGPNQPREEIHQLVRGAVVGKRPIAAVYDGCRRLLCPHKLGWNRSGQLRVLCYQYGGESVSGLQSQNALANWRCLALEKLSAVELLDDAWHTAPNHLATSDLYRAHRSRCGGLPAARATKWTVS